MRRNYTFNFRSNTISAQARIPLQQKEAFYKNYWDKQPEITSQQPPKAKEDK